MNIVVPLSYLPAGTGNDFSREMNLTHDARSFRKSFQRIIIIDLEFLTYHEHNSGTIRHCFKFAWIWD